MLLPVLNGYHYVWTAYQSQYPLHGSSLKDHHSNVWSHPIAHLFYQNMMTEKNSSSLHLYLTTCIENRNHQPIKSWKYRIWKFIHAQHNNLGKDNFWSFDEL